MEPAFAIAWRGCLVEKFTWNEMAWNEIIYYKWVGGLDKKFPPLLEPNPFTSLKLSLDSFLPAYLCPEIGKRYFSQFTFAICIKCIHFLLCVLYYDVWNYGFYIGRECGWAELVFSYFNETGIRTPKTYRWQWVRLDRWILLALGLS